MTLRVVFLGSPAFAAPSLQALAADTRISIDLVVTQPDRPAGRGRRLTAPPIAVAARELALPLFQPETLRSDATLDVIDALTPDLLVVVAYGELLNRRALRLAPHGALNVHPSLLPKYRGAAPIPAAILNGDIETGVSIMRLVRRLDAGPVIRQERLTVEPRATSGALEGRLAGLAAAILPDVCVAWSAGRLVEEPQDENVATYTREWSRADAEIVWARPAAELDRLIRAANPRPVAWTPHRGSQLRVLESKLLEGEDSRSPGTVHRSGSRVVVTCGAGALELIQVQPAGKSVLDALSWWNGLHSDALQLG